MGSISTSTPCFMAKNFGDHYQNDKYLLNVQTDNFRKHCLANLDLNSLSIKKNKHTCIQMLTWKTPNNRTFILPTCPIIFKHFFPKGNSKQLKVYKCPLHVTSLYDYNQHQKLRKNVTVSAKTTQIFKTQNQGKESHYITCINKKNKPSL